MKKLFIFFFILFNSILNAQNDILEKVIIEFNYFKYPDTEYQIDFKNNEVKCIMKYKISDNSYHIISDKTYKFNNEQFIKFKGEINLNIPDSIIHKSEQAMDGGGFSINFFNKNGTTSKLITRNINLQSKKYHSELKLIDSFFEFIYSVVKDNEGLKILDKSYRPYFSGLPIRKISENPLEYKIWGGISGNATWKNELIPFLENLPKETCVIIDCDNQLSYAWQEDILKLYILKNSNIQFANMDWLKYTRENLIELKEKLIKNEKNEIELVKLKNTKTYNMYINNKSEIEKWLKLPKKSIIKTTEQCRKICENYN
ncbi:hypothetical protein GFJ94_03920 [Flavobacterium sp. LMO8]|uniref:hypothetical protein n=1 Tax=Flavobacterium sp. LMO8 TaxID=2654244 RepID=UPI001292725A|nr:hypothetical protein [Flavobacterium sp. LMO8]MQP24209.1 hypothetical protein [Flavobacterium sp. LMO8]